MDSSAHPQAPALKTLLLSDLVDSTKLVEKLGDSRAAEVFGRHDRLARDLLPRFDGREIDKTDGFLLLFGLPLAAVRYATAYHEGLRELSERQGVALAARVGIHLGQVILRENPRDDVARGAKPVEVEGLAKPEAARLMSLAGGGQTLLTQPVFQIARRDAVGQDDLGRLRWLAHGSYRFQGIEEPVAVFEVGIDGLAPLRAPAGSAKVRRVPEAREEPAKEPLSSDVRVNQRSLASGAERPSVAVLFFDVLSRDVDLEWLRTGLTDLLVTDLSQSPEIDVVSTDRIYQILKDVDALDERITSFEMIREVAERADVETVLVGSVAKAGNNIRIIVKVQEAATGRIVSTDRADGVGEESLFSMVDELSLGVRRKLEPPETSASGRELDITDVTTSSIEAFRYFAEGLLMRRQGKEEESIPLTQRAIELDPDFGSALAQLALAYGAIGMLKEREECEQRAFELRERLLPRERYYIEGLHYRRNDETVGRSIDAFRMSLKMAPDIRGAPDMLAGCLAYLERYQEVVEVLEGAVRRGATGAYTHGGLAVCYAVLGEFEKGYRVLQEVLRQKPDSFGNHCALGELLIGWGKLDEALQALEKSDSLRPGDWRTLYALGKVFILREEWQELDAILQGRLGSGSSIPHAVFGSFLRIDSLLYRGLSSEARELLERSIQTCPDQDEVRFMFQHTLASLLLECGEASRARELVDPALSGLPRNLLENDADFLAARTELLAGQVDAAQRKAEMLEKKAERLGSRRLARLYHHLTGELALARGDVTAAVVELEQADSMLPPGAVAHPFQGLQSDHVQVWYSLAGAYLAAGDDPRAIEILRKITESGFEHAGEPIPYVRSFYLLGTTLEKQGEMDEARRAYERFLGYWEDGDLNRDWVADAKRKLDSWASKEEI